MSSRTLKILKMAKQIEKQKEHEIFKCEDSGAPHEENSLELNTMPYSENKDQIETNYPEALNMLTLNGMICCVESNVDDERSMALNEASLDMENFTTINDACDKMDIEMLNNEAVHNLPANFYESITDVMFSDVVKIPSAEIIEMNPESSEQHEMIICNTVAENDVENISSINNDNNIVENGGNIILDISACTPNKKDSEFVNPFELINKRNLFNDVISEDVDNTSCSSVYLPSCSEQHSDTDYDNLQSKAKHAKNDNKKSCKPRCKTNIKLTSPCNRKKLKKKNKKCTKDTTDTTCHSDVEEVIGNVPKKRKRGYCQRIERKKRKDAGEPYRSAKGYLVPGKSVKPNPCKKCKHGCSSIDEKQRMAVFSLFNGLTVQQQNDWICSHVTEVNVSRRRKDAKNPGKRNVSYRYELQIEGKSVSVCRQFFTATLGIGKKKIEYTVKHAADVKTAKSDSRGKLPSQNKTPDEIVEEAKNYISNLPAVPSHYCRMNTTRRYLPASLNMVLIYKNYKELMESNNKPVMSINVFKNIFNSFNLAFHKPKKDKCAICEKMKNKKAADCFNEDEQQEYILHQQEKKATYENYTKDIKETKENPSVIVASFDLQRVLSTPHSDSTLMYYSRKYAFYNLTVYENRNGRGHCFLWGECDGKKGANEISSCVSRWLDEINNEIKAGTPAHIILYCDNCPSQNKNRCMFSMLYHKCQNLSGIKSLELKFLLTGHTYMGADTIHSTIGTFIKKRSIMAPSLWPVVIALARTNPDPLKVVKMEYTDIQDWQNIQDKYFPIGLKDSSGNKMLWSCLKGLKFEKGSKTVEFWYENHQKVSMSVELLKRKKSGPIIIPRAYKKKLPISDAKYKDLQTLCKKFIIPPDHHEEYLSLPSSSQARDCLVDTDEEEDWEKNDE